MQEPDPRRDPVEALGSVAEALAGQLSLAPLLDRILQQAVALLRADAGSISSVDEQEGVYRKEVDLGVSCQSGRVFPLSEGMTGAVVAARGPVMYARYADVPGGHVRAEDRSRLRAVIGVPIRWRGATIGACVVFSRDDARRFGAADARLLELFAVQAAAAIATARLHATAETRARAEASAAERNRVARDVHDSVARGVAAVLVDLSAAQDFLAAGDPDRAATAVTDAQRAARTALDETRRSVLGLAPSPLEGRTLVEALELELHWVARAGEVDSRLVTAGSPVPLRPELAHQLFRIAQEALTNAARHARARTVRVGIVYGADGVTLLVQDDGDGFDAAAATGAGLAGMAERARLGGGRLTLDSVPAWGTSVRAELPYRPPAAADPPAERLRLLVVDAQPAFRAGIARLVAAAEPAVQVVGEVATGKEALDAYRTLDPDVVLTALRLPDLDGAQLIGLLRAAAPGAAVVALAGPGDADLVGDALRDGARGCLDRGADGTELGRAVLAAAHGDTLLSEAALGRLQARLGGATHPALTSRERDVHGLLARGLADKQIGAELGISAKTVEKHVGALLRKLAARNRVELATRFQR